MASGGERARIEVAFKGSHSIAVTVAAEGADALQRALADDRDGVFELDAEDGRYVIPLRSVVYVKRLSRDTHIGFGATP